jgi:hypothetical protein
MKFLLNLYPAAWQKRYRAEMEAQFDIDLPVFRTSLDLLAGAVDAWLHPEWLPETQNIGATETMITASRCAPLEISRADALHSAAWMIGLSLLLTGVGVTLDKTLGENVMTNALLYSAFFIALTLSSSRTFLKPYSQSARRIMTIAASVGWYLFCLAMAAIAAMI